MLVINSNFIYNENVLNSLPDIYMTIKMIGCISRGKIEICMIRVEILIYKISVSLFIILKEEIKMNEIIEKEQILIEDMIYEVRGVQVMLDSDIAKLYQVETKRVNEAVKNNPDKFPERFSWVLTNEETKKLRSKISTLEIKGQGKYSKYAPRVFTEQGLYMLATILKSKVATEVSIAIMDTFVKMRHYINYNKDTNFCF